MKHQDRVGRAASSARGTTGRMGPAAVPGRAGQASKSQTAASASATPGSEQSERIVVGHGVIAPGGKVDPEALRRLVEQARRDDEDAQLPTITFTLSHDLRKRLDRYLTDRIPFMSRTQLQRLIEGGGVLVNRRRPKAATVLRRGDVVDVVVPPPTPPRLVPEPIPLEIMYEDEDIVVINKAAGIIVHPARSHLRGTMVNALAWHLAQSGTALPRTGAPQARPGVVHRLDRHTSGVIVFAKRDETHWHLARQFQERRVEKRYLAVVHGRVEPPADAVALPIGPSPSRQKGYREKYVVRHDELGREALTIYRAREWYDPHHPDPMRRASLVELELRTGRTHQIRVHMSHLGFPVVGDEMYGGQAWEHQGRCVMARQALHAALLAFEHPRTGRPMIFTAPVPEDMAELIGMLRQRPGMTVLPTSGTLVDLSRVLRHRPNAPAPRTGLPGPGS